jgi:GlpG protein
MRQIGTIPSESDAVRFSDYLLAHGMKNAVEESAAGGWFVWVEDDDHLERAGSELGAFLANPADPRYEQAAQHAEALRAEEERRAHRRRKMFVDVRTRWGQPRQWSVPVTLGLIILSLGVFVLQWRDQSRGAVGVVDALSITPAARIISTPDGERVIPRHDLSPVWHGQVWRLVTPIFLHFSIMHVVFNMFWLRDLGAMIESRRGSLFFAILVLVSAVLSNLAQYEHRGPFFGGMSGVVYALFGFVWLTGRFNPGAGIGLSPDTVTIMLLWLVLCMTGILGPIANTAHVVGLLIGCAFAAIPHWLRRLVR